MDKPHEWAHLPNEPWLETPEEIFWN